MVEGILWELEGKREKYWGLGGVSWIGSLTQGHEIKLHEERKLSPKGAKLGGGGAPSKYKKALHSLKLGEN